MDDEVLACFRGSALQFNGKFFYLRFAFLNSVLQLLGEAFYVGLHACVAYGATCVLAKILNGCMLLWHNVSAKISEIRMSVKPLTEYLANRTLRFTNDAFKSPRNDFKVVKVVIKAGSIHLRYSRSESF